MENASDTKALNSAAAVVVLAGLAAILYGIAHDDLARSIGGLGLALIGLATIALVQIRRWVTDTADERRILAAAQRQAQSERTRYIAAQAALENEQGRLNRDMAGERLALAARLKAERAALARDFDEQKGALIAETVEATVLMYRSGKLAPDRATAAARLIQFPRQHPESQPECARSREHGVVGP